MSSGTSIPVSFDNTAVSNYIKVKPMNYCSVGDSSTKYITVNLLPANPGMIQGEASVCKGQTGVTYSIGVIPYADTYVWTLPSGATGNSTTNSITVDFSSLAASGNITVRGFNNCGLGPVSTLAVSTSAIPEATITPSGPTAICGNSPITLTASPGNSYLWNGGSTEQSIITNVAGDYSVTVTNSNGCTAISNVISITVNPLPIDLSQWELSPENPLGLLVSQTGVCPPSEGVIRLIHPQSGVIYRLMYEGAGYEPAQTCSCDTLTLNTGDLITTSNFQISAINSITGCGILLDTTVTITINPADRIVQLKLYLEGLYEGGGLMREARTVGFMPRWSVGIADKIDVELRDTNSYHHTIYADSNVMLSTSGQATLNVPCPINSSYYFTIKHRNSIETVSASPISLAAQNTSYDFTTGANRAYGNNMKPMGSVYVIYGGDVNQDGIVDGSDMSAIDNASTAILTGYYPEDINGDGLVDASDMAIIDNNSTMVIHKATP